jgi:isoleucyl-tRNA synthetase
MGGFYLDIIKDRQYTTGADSLPRRSAQTALYLIADAMARWMAPVLSFTADEIWENLPGDREDSVFLALWGDALPRLDAGDPLDADFWARVVSVRAAVNRHLESLRAAGELRGSLDAEVTLYCDAALTADLSRFADELRFLLITSGARIAPLADAPAESAETELTGLRIAAKPSEAEKCARCWHRREDVGSHAAHPTLCGRCVSNVEGQGEERRFA